jgi:hypothetical protein
MKCCTEMKITVTALLFTERDVNIDPGHRLKDTTMAVKSSSNEFA